MCRMASDVVGAWQQLGVRICNDCQFKASDDGVFQSHVCRKKKNQISIKFKKQLNVFTCSSCKIEQNEHDFIEHLQCHLQKKPFKCSYCDKYFETKCGVYSHFRQMHSSMPNTYELSLEEKTEKYLEMARNKGQVFIIPIRKHVAPELPLTLTKTKDVSKVSLPSSQSSCHPPRSSSSSVISSTAQPFRSQSSNDTHTRSFHPSIDNGPDCGEEIPFTSEIPETPVMHQISSSNSKPIHNSTITSCSSGNKPSSFSTGPPHISESSVVPVETLVSNTGKTILHANTSCPPGHKNPPSTEPPPYFTPTSIPYGDKVSQSCCYPQTSLSPAILAIAQLTSELSSQNTLSSEYRVSPSCTNFQTAVLPVISLRHQPPKAMHAFEEASCPQRCIRSQPHLDHQTSLSSTYSVANQQSEIRHTFASSSGHLGGINSANQHSFAQSPISLFNGQPSMSTSIFVPLHPSPLVQNVSQWRAGSQNSMPPLVSMTPQLSTCLPVPIIQQTSSDFQGFVPPTIFPTNQLSNRMPNLTHFLRPSMNKVSKSVVGSSRAVLPPSIHLNTQAPREIPTLSKSLYATKENTTQSCVVKSVPQASVIHPKICSSQQASPSPSERLAPNEQHMQGVVVQHGSNDMRIVNTNFDLELKPSVGEENLSQDLEFLNIFCDNNEIVFVCSKCKVKFKERAPFFHHIWKKHAHTHSDSPCCTSNFNESCIHLQRIIKLLDTKAMGLFNIQLEKNQLSAYTSEVVHSEEIEKGPLSPLGQQPLQSSTSVDNGSCERNLSESLNILKGDPNCITQLQIKLEDIAGETGIEEYSSACLPTANEEPAKPRNFSKENNADNNLRDTEVEAMMMNPSNQLGEILTSDLNAVRKCEETIRKDNVSCETFQNQIDKASEKLSACTNKVSHSAETEKGPLSAVQQQLLLPPTSVNTDSILICQPNQSECLEILKGDKNCITELQIEAEQLDGEIGIGEHILAGLPSANINKENNAGDTLNVNNVGDKDVEVVTNLSNPLCEILRSELNTVKRCEEKTRSSCISSKNDVQSQDDNTSENLASDQDVNIGEEIANPKIRLQKEDHAEQIKIQKHDENRENSASISHEHSLSKAQMKISERNPKGAILSKNRHTNHVSHIHEQLLSDTEMKPRDDVEENSEADLHRLDLHEADEERGHLESSVDVTNTEEENCGNEETNGSTNAQTGKDPSSVMTKVTLLTSDASNIEKNHIKTAESNLRSSEYECVQNSKSDTALERTNDYIIKKPLFKEGLMVTESSDETLCNFFKCAFSDCDFSSFIPVDLLIHNQEIHGMECIFSCFYCGFEAKSTSELLHHMDSHLDLTCDSYSGSIWKNAFTEKIKGVENKVLRTTINVMEFESRSIENVGYSCNLCGVRFTSLKALGCHFEESTLRTYSCRYCRAHFLDSKSAEKHIREEHPKLTIFRRQHRKLLCKDRALNNESFSKLVRLRQNRRDADASNKVHSEKENEIPNSKNFVEHPSSLNYMQCHSQPLHKVSTEMETNDEIHADDGNLPGILSASEINGSEGSARKEDVSTSQAMVSSSQPSLLCADKSKSTLTVPCLVSKQLEIGDEVGPLNLDKSIPKHVTSPMKEHQVMTDGNNDLSALRKSPLSESANSKQVLMENDHIPLTFHESSTSPLLNTKTNAGSEVAGLREEVATPKGQNSCVLEKSSTSDLSISSLPSNNSERMPRIFDLCAEKSIADCLRRLYSQIQDGLYSCNGCSKKVPRLRNMLCHIFFCQGKISVVNCPYNCTFESEHPKIIIRHIQENHPNKDPECKSFRCINVTKFFQYLKGKDVNQFVLEKACKMQNEHEIEMKISRSRNSSVDSDICLKRYENFGDKEDASAESENEITNKVSESAEVHENQDSTETQGSKLSYDMSLSTAVQNESEISQSKTTKMSLAAETMCLKGNLETSNEVSSVEMKSLQNAHDDEVEFVDKAQLTGSITEKEGEKMETRKVQVDPPCKERCLVASKPPFDKNSLYQCKLCYVVINFNIDRMVKHISEKHALFECGYCERPYHNLTILKNHIRFAHNKSLPKFQPVSPELIFTRVDSTLTETSCDNDVKSQEEENREISSEDHDSPPPVLPYNSASENFGTLSPKQKICEDFPEEGDERKRRDDHPATATSSILKANDLNCLHEGEIYFESNHRKEGKRFVKAANEKCHTPDFASHVLSGSRPASLEKQMFNEKKPKSDDSREIGINFKENLSQIKALGQSKKAHSSQHEENPNTSKEQHFPGGKELSLKRKADEVFNDHFLYDQQQHMKKPCCDKLVHKDTWEMETRCRADLSLAYSHSTNHHQSMEPSPESAHEASDSTSDFVPQAKDPSPGYDHEAENPSSDYSHEIMEPSPEFAPGSMESSPEYVHEAKEPSHDLNVSFCTTNGYLQPIWENHFTIGDGFKRKMIGQPFSCTNCMISLPSISEMKIHFANDHLSTKTHWFEQRTWVDYSTAGEKLYHKTDVRPSVASYLCGYCTFQSPFRDSISKHMTSAHNSMEYHFVLPTTEGKPVAYTERCWVASEEESGTTCKHEMLTTEKSRPKLRYRCHLCDTYLESVFLFRLHLAKHGGFKHCSILSSTRGLLLCATCGYVASSSHDLASHVNRHMTERRFSCSYCGYDDHKKKGIYVHIKKHHGDDSSAYAVDNNQQNKDVDIRPKLVDLDPVVCLKEFNYW